MAYTLYASSAARAWKFQAVAIAAGVSLEVRVVSKPDKAVLALSPFEKLPVLQTPQGVVGRSNAILRFLAGHREDSALYGESPFAEAEVDQWLEFCSTSIEPLLLVLVDGLDGKSAEQQKAAAAMAEGRLPPLLAFMDGHLASRTWLAGDRFSLADIALSVAVSRIYQRDIIAKAELTHLKRWFTTCSNQPAVAAALGGKAAASSAGGANSARAGAATGGAGAGAVPVSRADNSAWVGTGVDTQLPSERFYRARTRVAELLARGEAAIGSTVTVCGWARTVREGGAGSLQFVALNDGSCFDSLQVVCEKDKTEGFEGVGRAGGTGASFRVVGTVVKSPAKGQVIELNATAVSVLGEVQDHASYPMAKKKHSLEFLRDLQHLRPRTNTIGAITRVRNACAYATHKFFQERGFLYIHTPIITTADCEGAGEMFQVTTIMPELSKPKGDLPRTKDGSIDYKKDFFAKPAMMTVSGQLQVEAFACSMSDVYTFGPTFRAENSHTSRHLAEFWMIEPEIAFATLEEDMALAEDYLKFCTAWVLDHCAEDLGFFEANFEKGLRERLNNVVREPFQRLTYTEAIELLTSPEHQKKGKFQEKVFWGCDLASEHERYITEQVYKKPVILVNYPKDIKAFYMKLNPDGKTVAAMDVLVPKIGEIIGGSQREDDPGRLRARMEAMGVAMEPLEWYLDLRKYGTVPHAGEYNTTCFVALPLRSLSLLCTRAHHSSTCCSPPCCVRFAGFGLGFERLVMYVTGIENIRDAIPFPRWPGNAAL